MIYLGFKGFTIFLILKEILGGCYKGLNKYMNFNTLSYLFKNTFGFSLMTVTGQMTCRQTFLAMKKVWVRHTPLPFPTWPHRWWSILQLFNLLYPGSNSEWKDALPSVRGHWLAERFTSCSFNIIWYIQYTFNIILKLSIHPSLALAIINIYYQI